MSKAAARYIGPGEVDAELPGHCLDVKQKRRPPKALEGGEVIFFGRRSRLKHAILDGSREHVALAFQAIDYNSRG